MRENEFTGDENDNFLEEEKEGADSIQDNYTSESVHSNLKIALLVSIVLAILYYLFSN